MKIEELDALYEGATSYGDVDLILMHPKDVNELKVALHTTIPKYSAILYYPPSMPSALFFCAAKIESSHSVPEGKPDFYTKIKP